MQDGLVEVGNRVFFFEFFYNIFIFAYNPTDNNTNKIESVFF